MIESQRSGEIVLKLCVLSHPDELAINFIKKLVTENQGQSTEFEALGVSIATIKVHFDDKRIKIVLLRTNGQEFFKKLRSSYKNTSGAIIFFTKENPISFEKARQFYHSFCKIVDDPAVPVTFMDVIDSSKEILFVDPEEAEDGQTLYYELNTDDIQAFFKILKIIAGKYLASFEE
ncbi:MAG: hypothetical protein ACFE9L_12060 [Candidatus Hodarchaeota archaeon]